MRFLVMGAGGFSREVADMLVRLGHTPAVFFSESPDAEVHDPTGLPVVSSLDGIDCDGAVIAVGDPALRRRFHSMLHRHFALPALVDPSAIVGPSAVLGEATLVMPFTAVSPNARIAENVLLNVGCYIAHDCVVGAHCHLAPAVQLGGFSTVGDGCFCGTGSIVLPGCSVGDGAVTGAGAVVTTDVGPRQTVVGVPARPLPAKNSPGV